jgi:RecJ-like exonuclease
MHNRTRPLEPTGDEIPLRTWRRESDNAVFARYYRYSYPTQGCHGVRLTVACQTCNGTGNVPVSMLYAKCGHCDGTGRVLMTDAPNRRDVP